MTEQQLREAVRTLLKRNTRDGYSPLLVFWRQSLPERRSDVMQARPTWRTARWLLGSALYWRAVAVV